MKDGCYALSILHPWKLYPLFTIGNSLKIGTGNFTILPERSFWQGRIFLSLSHIYMCVCVCVGVRWGLRKCRTPVFDSISTNTIRQVQVTCFCPFCHFNILLCWTKTICGCKNLRQYLSSRIYMGGRQMKWLKLESKSAYVEHSQLHLILAINWCSELRLKFW